MLLRIRVLIFYALFVSFTFLLFVFSYIPVTFFKLPYSLRYKIGVVFSYGIIWLARFCCGLKYNVTGLEKLPNTPCIVVANHQSFWDQIFMQLIIPKHSWVLKKELFNLPLLGWGLRMVSPIAVDRNLNLSVAQILREGQNKILEGLWLIIFPESTRIRPDTNVRFKPSAMKLATVAKVPIVMIAHNAGIFWPKGFWIIKSGTIQVKIIDVIGTQEILESDVRSLTNKVESIINNEKQKLYENEERML